MQRFALASAMPLLASAHTAVASRRLLSTQSHGTAAPTNSNSTTGANAAGSSSSSTAFAEDGRTQQEINKLLREKIERLEAQNAAQQKATPKTFEDFFRSNGAAEGNVFTHHGGVSAHPFFVHPAARFSPFLKVPTGPDGAIYYGRQFSFLGFLFKVFLWLMLFKMLVAMLMVSSVHRHESTTTVVGPDGTPVTLRYSNPHYNSIFSSCGSPTGCPAWTSAMTIPPHPKDGAKNVEIQ